MIGLIGNTQQCLSLETWTAMRWQSTPSVAIILRLGCENHAIEQVVGEHVIRIGIDVCMTFIQLFKHFTFLDGIRCVAGRV